MVEVMKTKIDKKSHLKLLIALLDKRKRIDYNHSGRSHKGLLP